MGEIKEIRYTEDFWTNSINLRARYDKYMQLVISFNCPCCSAPMVVKPATLRIHIGLPEYIDCWRCAHCNTLWTTIVSHGACDGEDYFEIYGIQI